MPNPILNQEQQDTAQQYAMREADNALQKNIGNLANPINYGTQSMTEPVNNMNANRQEMYAKTMQDMQDRALARENMDINKLNTAAQIGNIGYEQGYKNRALRQEYGLTSRNIANQEAQTKNIEADFAERQKSDMAKRQLEREQFEHMKKSRLQEMLQMERQNAVNNMFKNRQMGNDEFITRTNANLASNKARLAAAQKFAEATGQGIDPNLYRQNLTSLDLLSNVPHLVTVHDDDGNEITDTEAKKEHFKKIPEADRRSLASGIREMLTKK
jgi:hypothetical protein